MGRRLKQVDEGQLQNAINQAEEAGAKNISHLCQQVAEIYNALPSVPEKITHSVVYLRIKQLGLKVNVKPGRRGGSSEGLKRWRESGVEKPRRRSRKLSEGSCDGLREMLKQNGAERYLPLVDRIESGSRTAALKLNCLACCAFVTAEVRNCGGGNLCPLHPFRPYQHMTDEQIEADDNQPLEEAA